MDLLQLEHFLAVVDEGSFTRAAVRVFRTQPAVSLSIKKLEDEIGAPLFARDTTELSLTGEGKALVESARRLVRLRDDTVRQLRKIRSTSSGVLSIAAHESAAVYLLPQPLREYLKTFPEIKVGIGRNCLEDIPGRVMDREVDIGFVKEKPPINGLCSMRVHVDSLVLIASPRHPLANRPRLTIEDLAGEPFIVHHQCSTTEQSILRMFDAHTVRCNIAAEMWSFENVKEFVRNDLGLAILPGICVTQELRLRTLVRLPLRDLDIARETLMIYRDQGLSESSQRFIEVMMQYHETALSTSLPRSEEKKVATFHRRRR
ncbi:MAG: LysR family transcriptional regulator [Candidatus Acidiferrales bacterium]